MAEFVLESTSPLFENTRTLPLEPTVSPPTSVIPLRWNQLEGMQQAMLRWEEFSPINAIHLAEVCSSYSQATLEKAIVSGVQASSIAPLELSSKLVSYRCEARNTAPLQVVKIQDPESDWQTVLDCVGSELNTPFPAGVHWPVRFTLVQTTDHRSFLLLCYRHAISDSQGSSELLKNILRELRGEHSASENSVKSLTLQEYFPNSSNLSARCASLIDTVREFPSTIRNFRPRNWYSAPGAIQSGINSEILELSQVQAVAKAVGVKIQALFLAAMAEAFSALSSRTAPRSNFTFYTPANMRQAGGKPAEAGLGMLLGGFHTHISGRSRLSFSGLAQRIGEQMQLAKQKQLHLRHNMKLELMSRIWDRLPSGINRRLGPLLLPVTALASNVNLNHIFESECGHRQLLNYYRFTGTGILTSMMVGLTTLGESINLSTTHPANFYTHAEIDGIREHIAARLVGLHI